MRRYIPFLFCGITLFFSSCQSNVTVDLEAAKNEILSAEKAFNDLAASRSVKEAFLAFSAEDAVLSRGAKMIKGKEAIGQYFDGQTLQNAQLQWKAEFVEVASSGDLGYTYGPFTFEAVDSSGQTISSQGFFHTVWKKQADGSWKFVYD